MFIVWENSFDGGGMAIWGGSSADRGDRYKTQM